MPFVAIESQPELIRREPAVYPEIAKKMDFQGRVTVEVTIDAQGKPIQARVVNASVSWAPFLTGAFLAGFS